MYVPAERRKRAAYVRRREGSEFSSLVVEEVVEGMRENK